MNLTETIHLDYDATNDIACINLLPGTSSVIGSTDLLRMAIVIAPLAIVLAPNSDRETCQWHFMQRDQNHDFALWVANLNQAESILWKRQWDRWQLEADGTIIRSVNSKLDLSQIFAIVGFVSPKPTSDPGSVSIESIDKSLGLAA